MITKNHKYQNEIIFEIEIYSTKLNMKIFIFVLI